MTKEQALDELVAAAHSAYGHAHHTPKQHWLDLKALAMGSVYIVMGWCGDISWIEGVFRERLHADNCVVLKNKEYRGQAGCEVEAHEVL